MSGYGYYGSDPYSADRGYPGAGGLPRPYDPSPPSRSQPQTLVYPQQEQVYRATPPAPAPQPSTREVKVYYYYPGDHNFQPPVLPAAAPVPVPAPLPAAPRPSYVETPAYGGSNQFREGDTFRVVAIQENKVSAARPPYRYPGGYDEYAAGPPQRRGGPVGYAPIYYQ